MIKFVISQEINIYEINSNQFQKRVICLLKVIYIFNLIINIGYFHRIL